MLNTVRIHINRINSSYVGYSNHVGSTCGQENQKLKNAWSALKDKQRGASLRARILICSVPDEHVAGILDMLHNILWF